MHLRVATPVDIPALHALIEGAFRGDASRAGWTHEADLLDGQRIDLGQLAAMLADPAQTFLIAHDVPGPLGCVLIVDRGDMAFISALSIRPSAQRGGLGSAMVAAAEDHARVLGRERMTMTVIRQRPELIAWYERRGYVQTGATLPFPYGQSEFGIPRRDDLIFVELAKSLRVDAQ